MVKKVIVPFMISEKDDALLGAPSKSDGMGVQDIWAERGRDLVPHLTGSTNCIQGFQILVETYRLWDSFLQTKAHQVYTTEFKNFFILIEQVFARIVPSCGQEWTLPGARSVKARISEVPKISLDESWHLLSGQLSNGIYGLYRGAAGRAGLLEEDLSQLSEVTMTEAQSKQGIEESQEQLFSLVTRALNKETVSISEKKYKELCDEIHETYKKPPLAEHFDEMFIQKHDLTQRLVDGIKSDKEFDYQEIDYRQFLTKMTLEFKTKNLSEYERTIKNVISCENLLSIVVFLFDWLCSQRGAEIETVTKLLPDTLHEELAPVLEDFRSSGVYTKTAKFNHTCFSENLDTSNNLALLNSILEIHRLISERRKRALWVWTDENGLLTSEIIVDPPDLEDLKVKTNWHHDYYLWPLIKIANQIAEVKECQN